MLHDQKPYKNRKWRQAMSSPACFTVSVVNNNTSGGARSLKEREGMPPDLSH